MIKHSILLVLTLICTMNASAYCYVVDDTVKTAELKEIVVTAKHDLVKTRGAVTTIQVDRTAFENVGAVSDMLPHLPGLVKTSGGIEVKGLGKPLFYVDGREIKDESELQTLTSDNIRKVQINRAPGAEYPSGTKAVVTIITKKHVSDYVFLNAANTFAYRRRFSEVPSFSFRAKKGKFSTSLSYVLSRSGNLLKETYFRDIVHDDYTFSLTQDRYIPNYKTNHMVNWVGEYNINKYSIAGIYYYYKNSTSDGHERGLNTIKDRDAITERYLDKRTRGLSNLHSMSLSYDYKKGDNSLHLSQDYATTTRNGNTGSNERTLSSGYVSEINTRNRTQYDVFTTNVRYNFVLPWSIGGVVGGRYVHVKSETDITSDNTHLTGDIYNNHMNVKEDNPQAYIMFEKQFSHFTITPGLRYEYMSRTIDDIIQRTAPTKVSQHFSNLYPEIKVEYNPNDDFSAYIHYTRSSVNPNFGSINSGLVYNDSLSYSDGNPELRSSVSNTLKFGITYKDWELEVSYENEKDCIEDYEKTITSNSNIVSGYSVNLDYSRLWNIMLSYSNTFGKLDFYADATLGLPDAEIVIMGERVKRRQPHLDSEINLSYKFNKRFSLYTDYVFQGHRQSTFMTQRSVQNWNLGMNASFLKNNRLKVTLEILDILHKANYNNMTDYYDNILSGTRGTNDMRGVRLRMSYTLFNKPVKIRTSRENIDVIRRVEN